MAPTFTFFKKRGLDQSGVLTAIIVLAVIASACTIFIVVILVSNWRSTRRIARRTVLERHISRLSEKSFSSPDAKIPVTNPAPIPKRRSSLFRRDGQRSPVRPDRPARPWGEDFSSVCVLSTRVRPKRRSSTIVMRTFSMRRSQRSMYPRPYPSTERPFILPTARTIAAPEKALARTCTRSVSLVGTGPGRLPHEDRDDCRPASSRAPFRKPHPLPFFIHERPNGDVAPEESMLPL
ncbi:hypothetical protein BDM02DRAFT_2712524 [Thelephora ganbajun]|uniref:Uncharacterized protein n=1 Tax=Thelephora ganbajun TaxID=370292 RepID=A0ACB6ZCP6_THEGA|nr:hypothetical protein BDM02DRAFT_2712524 [Thelephora ganbajun]